MATYVEENGAGIIPYGYLTLAGEVIMTIGSLYFFVTVVCIIYFGSKNININ